MSMGDAVASIGALGTILVLILVIIWILLPLKLWRMAERHKDLLEETKLQNEILRMTFNEIARQGKLREPECTLKI
jgi:hypothetical protein